MNQSIYILTTDHNLFSTLTKSPHDGFAMRHQHIKMNHYVTQYQFDETCDKYARHTNNHALKLSIQIQKVQNEWLRNVNKQSPQKLTFLTCRK
jgi:hypothetical protein